MQTLRLVASLLAFSLVLTTATTARGDETVKIGLPLGNALGRPSAPLILVEFTDLQCPFCRRFHVETFERVKKAYMDTGKVLFVSRDLPRKRHDWAMHAARAARCAGEQGKYWQARHTLLVNADKLNPDFIAGAAAGLGLNMTEFFGCALSGRYVSEIQRDVEDATLAGISVTPTFVLGRVTADGMEGVKIVGAQPFEVFDEKIRAMLDGR